MEGFRSHKANVKRLSSLEEREANPCLTALMTAVCERDEDLVQALLLGGANLEARDRLGRNVLYHAFPASFSDKSMTILRLLLDQGVNTNTSLDSDGCSALVTAVVMDQPDVVALLLSHGVDVDDPAMSKFHGSLSSSKAEEKYDKTNNNNESVTTQFIFSKGCEHNVTPLLCAVMCRRHTIVQMLIDADAGTNCVSSGSFWRAANISVCSTCEIEVTPLHMAAYIGDLYTTQFLIDHKNIKEIREETCARKQLSYNDITPLWFALLRGHPHIVQLFLSYGKPVAPPCHFGSGLQVCLQGGFTPVAMMILRAGYDLEDDMDWIECGEYPTHDCEVIGKILSLVGQPRSLLECCCFSLREKYGAGLDCYLNWARAPKKICDVLTFKDLLSTSCGTDHQLCLSTEVKVKGVTDHQFCLSTETESQRKLDLDSIKCEIASLG